MVPTQRRWDRQLVQGGVGLLVQGEPTRAASPATVARIVTPVQESFATDKPKEMVAGNDDSAAGQPHVPA